MIKNKNNLPTTRNFLLERDLFGMKIPMRTKDGCYDLNEMLSEYNKHNPNNQKRLSKFFQSEDTQTYINNLTKIRFAELSGNMQLLDNQVCNLEQVPVNQLVMDSTKNFKVSVKVDKIERVILQKTKGKTQSNGKKDKDTVFADSLLMKKFARWLNPMYEVAVDKWIEDDLIKLRNDLADNNTEWCSMLAKLGASKDNDGYKIPNRLKNYIIINDHYTGCRNNFSIEQMRECLSLEKEIIRLVDFKMIKNIDELINYLSRIYLQKYPNSVLPNLNQ